MAINSGTVSDPDGDPVTLSASVGIITDNGDGTWSWDYMTGDGPDQSQTVTITAEDDGGSSETTFELAVDNVAPDFEAGADDTLNPPVAGAFSRAGITFTDPGADVWTGTVNWGDSPDDEPLTIDQAAKSFDLAHTYTSEGTFTVSVTVQDDDDSSHTDTFQVTVYLNTPPTAEAGGPYSGDEGSAIPLDGATASDPDEDTLTYAWSVDDAAVCSFDDASALNPNLTCSDDGTYQVTLAVDDGQYDPVSDSATVTVNNVAPTATFGNDGPVDEGSSFTLSLSGASDPSTADTDAGFEYAFDCGDGSGYAFSTSSSAVCPTDDNGVRAVKGKIKDKDGGVTEYTASVTVNNVAPTIGAITAPIDPVDINDQPVSVEVAFSDPGTADTHDVTWDWGDETSDTQTGAGSPATQGHAYAEAGVYVVTVTATDDDGGSATGTYEFIVIYDPDSGFVTGGGWIMSPEGAYAADPTLTGKANFGFVSKYKKGASVPTGKTEFQFKAGDLNFQSSSYDWLVIAGARAKYKGLGTINGAGNYGFMLTATDAELTSSTDVDLFRIKIWDRDTDEVVYDNKMGADDDGYAGTEIGGGNIKIHKAK